MSVVAASPCRKGRPRDERIDTQITSAALLVLADDGFERFSVEEVASRAGVAKTTIYRRFSTREQLIIGALGRLNDYLADPADGPIRDRLVDLLRPVRYHEPGSVASRIFMNAAGCERSAAEVGQLVRKHVLAPRREVLRSILEEGKRSGELRSDLDLELAIPILVGPMLYMKSWAGQGESNASVESLVDVILAGMSPANDS